MLYYNKWKALLWTNRWFLKPYNKVRWSDRLKFKVSCFFFQENHFIMLFIVSLKISLIISILSCLFSFNIFRMAVVTSNLWYTTSFFSLVPQVCIRPLVLLRLVVNIWKVKMVTLNWLNTILFFTAAQPLWFQSVSPCYAGTTGPNILHLLTLCVVLMIIYLQTSSLSGFATLGPEVSQPATQPTSYFEILLGTCHK